MVTSTIITLSGPAILNKFAIGLAGEAGTWVFKQILHSASGGSDTDKIRRDISGAVTEMKELKRTVDTLSRELPQALLQLRSDNLRESLTKIETMYDTITDLMETAVTLPEDMYVERDKKLNYIQTRLEDRLRMFSNDVPGILDRINDFLAEDGPRSFVCQAVQKAFDTSDEFVSYYEKSKTSMLSYWVVVVKGISLLQMAYDAPNVDSSEGMLTIRRQKDKLDRQEQIFKAVVGENTVRLVESALLRPSPALITLLTNEGYWIGPKHPSFGDFTLLPLLMGTHIPIYRRPEDLGTANIKSMWEMPFGCAFDADLKNAVRFEHISSKSCMSHNGANVSTVKNDGQFTSHSVSWFIKPVCPGSDRYTIRAARNLQLFRSTIFIRRLQASDVLGSYLVARDRLRLESSVSSSDAGAKFQIKV